MSHPTDSILDGVLPRSSPASQIRVNEQAFRRGFSHAAEYVADALRGGATIQQIENWIQRIDEWRFSTPATSPVIPPSVWGKK